jgi:hypothetical protein
LGHIEFPFVYLDATYLNVASAGGQPGQMTSMAVVVATGIAADGPREILGLDVGDSEDEVFWRGFLASLKQRGLSGVRLVISDQHAGLAKAVKRSFQGARAPALPGPLRPQPPGPRAQGPPEHGRRGLPLSAKRDRARPVCGPAPVPYGLPVPTPASCSGSTQPRALCWPTSVDVAPESVFLAFGEGGVWTMGSTGEVVHVDPATNSVVATIPTGGDVFHGDVAVGGGYVWVRVSESLFAQIDPATDTVVARYGPPSEGSGGIDADTQAVWVSDYLAQTLWRLPLD